MNSRNIKANLRKKHNEWLESIEDKEVKELAKKNSIITGGAITSLLLGDKPSDYDIYFLNFETTVKVAEYYAKRIKSNEKVYVGIGPNKYLYPGEKGQDWANLELAKNRVWLVVKSSGIAGSDETEGYAYFETIANPENVDIENYVDELVGKLEKEDGKKLYQPVFCSSNAISLSGKIQIILRFWGDVEEIHQNFDFIHCTNYWTSNTGYLHLTKESLEATINKQLIYKGSKYPLASMFRIRKFMQKGWYINAGDMLKIGYQIAELDLNDLEVLQDQLIGVDVAYFHSLLLHLKELKEKDPNFNMGFNYLSTVLERVF